MKKTTMCASIDDKINELNGIITSKCDDNKTKGVRIGKGTSGYKRQIANLELIKQLVSLIDDDDVKLDTNSTDKFNRLCAPISEKIGGKRIIIELGMNVMDLIITYPNLNLTKLNKKLEKTDWHVDMQSYTIVEND